MEGDALDEWVEERRRGGAAVGVVDGRASITEHGFFDAVARALHLPDYFGHNWDALDEVLDDLSWLPGDEHLLVLRDAKWVLDEEPQERLRILVDVLRRAAEDDDPDSRAMLLRTTDFTTVLHASPDDEETMRRRYDGVGAFTD